MTTSFNLSGYSETREFIAQRSHRGNYQTFTLALPIAVLTTLVPIPDPDNPTEDNRVVSEPHARAFGRYWRTNKMWITPPILLDTALPLNAGYSEIGRAGTLTVGKIELPYDSERQLRILDGQHRILGWVLATETIADELTKARDLMLESHQRENQTGEETQRRVVENLELERKRLRDEHITVEILVGVTAVQHKKFFVDIAVNAKGISKSRTASFNQERMMSRLGLFVSYNHPLLKDRVDEEHDRVGGPSAGLISLKNAIDLCRESTWGVPSRWTDNREGSNDEDNLKSIALAFFDSLCEGSSALTAVSDGEKPPSWLRQNSMCGSTSMLRVLAGVFAQIAVEGTQENAPTLNEEGREQFVSFLRMLDQHLQYVRDGGQDPKLDRAWRHDSTSKFFVDAGAKTPSGRPQAMREFVTVLADWARAGEVFPETRGETS